MPQAHNEMYLKKVLPIWCSVVVLLSLWYCSEWDMVVWPRAAVLGLTCCCAAGRTLGKEKCEKAEEVGEQHVQDERPGRRFRVEGDDV